MSMRIMKAIRKGKDKMNMLQVNKLGKSMRKLIPLDEAILPWQIGN
jgi:hypothetical protein